MNEGNLKMRLVTWNVNGLRACMNKGFDQFFKEMNADFFAIQETKMQENQKSFGFDGYFEYWNSADKPGYSGTLIYAKNEPIGVHYGTNEGLYKIRRLIFFLPIHPDLLPIPVLFSL